jgi:hypothetical protein
MIKVTQAEWNKKSNDFKGEWTESLWEWRNGDFPKEWIGKKTMLHYDNGTCLLTEGVHFEIIP